MGWKLIQHRWDISPAEAVALQSQLAEEVRIVPLKGEVHTVAGADCAFLGGGSQIIAAAVICDAKSMQVIASASEILPCGFSYIPGLLSFREAPAVIEAVRKLPCCPDLLICDGQGVAHRRGLGLACHVGLWLDIPTIGVAKSRLCGSHRTPGLRRGSRRPLRLAGKVIGSVVRTRTDVKPLYVSVGHRVALEDAIGWTLSCARGYRLPEPTRQAHMAVTRLKKHQ